MSHKNLGPDAKPEIIYVNRETPMLAGYLPTKYDIYGHSPPVPWLDYYNQHRAMEFYFGLMKINDYLELLVAQKRQRLALELAISENYQDQTQINGKRIRAEELVGGESREFAAKRFQSNDRCANACITNAP